MTMDSPPSVPAWYAASPFWALVPCPLWSPLRRRPVAHLFRHPSGKTAMHDRLPRLPAPVPTPRLGLIPAQANR